jgi:hypothetical protein
MAAVIETIIINCSTREQTTLALVSAVRNGAPPVHVIDCESTDGSGSFFRALQRRLPFTLSSMPLRPHGTTLDRIFRESRCDALLLIDSDAEIVRQDVVPRILAGRATDADGSGVLHEGQWLGANHLVAGNIGYYAPRMWIPCVLLEVAAIRDALDAGQSFRARIFGNELARMPGLSQFLHLRFRVPLLRRMRLDALRSHHGTFDGVAPHYVYWDTGAAMHRHLLQRSLRFADLGAELREAGVRHYHGVTRRRLRRTMRNAANFEASRREAIERIERVYGVPLPELELKR